MAPGEVDFQCLFAVVVHRIPKSLIMRSRRRWKGCDVTKWNEDHKRAIHHSGRLRPDCFLGREHTACGVRGHLEAF